MFPQRSLLLVPVCLGAGLLLGRAEPPAGGPAGRAEARRTRLVPAGGSEATEAAVTAGLLWLARHQDPGGRWSARLFAQQCAGTPCEGTGSGEHDIGLSGLALLAFLGAGYTDSSTDAQVDPLTAKTVVLGDVIESGLGWLLGQEDNRGRIGTAGGKPLYGHAIACTALCEACALGGAERLRVPAQRAVDHLVAARNPGSAWRYQPNSGENDTSVTGWCFLALVAARRAGLRVDEAAAADAIAYLAAATAPDGQVGYRGVEDAGSKVVCPNMNEDYANHPTPAAIALLCRSLHDRAAAAPTLLLQAQLLARDPPLWDKKKKTNDYYYWYYGTSALFHFDGPAGDRWQAWNRALVAALLPNQRTGDDGCAEGSWDPDDRWGFEGGRIYATALNTLTLETYYRCGTGDGR